MLMKKNQMQQELEDARAGKSDNQFSNSRLKEFLEIDKGVKAARPKEEIAKESHKPKDMKSLFQDSEEQQKAQEEALKLERNRDIMKRIKDMHETFSSK